MSRCNFAYFSWWPDDCILKLMIIFLAIFVSFPRHRWLLDELLLFENEQRLSCVVFFHFITWVFSRVYIYSWRLCAIITIYCRDFSKNISLWHGFPNRAWNMQMQDLKLKKKFATLCGIYNVIFHCMECNIKINVRNCWYWNKWIFELFETSIF